MTGNILIIEDDSNFQKTLYNILKNQGYDVKVADSTDDAKILIEQCNFDLVITDVRLPKEDGITFLKKMFKNSEYRPKTIVMTGYQESSSPIDAIKIGVNDFINKPFKTEELLSKVHHFIRERKIEKTVNHYKNISIIDPQTDAFTQRYFFEILYREIERAKRFSHALGLILVNIAKSDEKKNKFGEWTEKEKIKEVGYRLKHLVRGIDLVFRYGDDSFVIILPETSRDAAYKAAERIVGIVKKEKFIDKTVDINMNIGIVSYPDDALDKDELLKKLEIAVQRSRTTSNNTISFS